MRNAIALFSTLVIMILVIMLMTIALKNTTSIREYQKLDQSLVQENIAIADIKELLKNKIVDNLARQTDIRKKVFAQKLLFLSPLRIQNKSHNIDIKISLQAIENKISINSVIYIQHQAYIKSILRNLGIKHVKTFVDILLANMDKDKYREMYSILEYNEDFKFGSIENMQEFIDIVDIYVQITNDYAAKRIKYEDYFNFLKYQTPSEINLDFNNMSLAMISSIPQFQLKSHIRKQILEKIPFTKIDELDLDENSRESLENLRPEFKTVRTKCSVNIKSINNIVEYQFDYNINDGKMTNIKIHR